MYKIIILSFLWLSTLLAQTGSFYLTIEEGETLESLSNKIKSEHSDFEKFPPKFLAAYLQYHNPKLDLTKPLKAGELIFVERPTKKKVVEVRDFYRLDKVEIKDKTKLSSKAFESRFYRRFQLMPITAFSKVDSNELVDNSQASIVSKQNFGLHVSFFQSLSPLWLGYLEAEYISRNYETSISGKNFSEANTKNYWVGASIKFSYLKGFNSSVGVYLSHSPFFYAASDDLISYTYGDLLKFRLSTEYEVYKTSMLNFRVYGFYAFLGGKDLTELDVEPGNSLGFELKSEWMTGVGVIISEVFYENINQNTSLATQNVVELGFRLGCQWDLL